MQPETMVPEKSKFIQRKELSIEGRREKAVELRRTFSIPVEKLYDCWANPKVFAQWWKGLIIKEMNPSQNGTYRFEWEGMPSDYAEGRYEELAPHSKIVFTWNTTGACAGEDQPITDTTVTLSFRSLESSQSELTLKHEGFINDTQCEAHYEGWTSCLQDLARAVGLKVEVTRQF